MSWRLWGPPTALSLFLIAVSPFSFLGFHTLAELFAIVISLVMFALAWATRRFVANNFLLFLACGYFWVGGLDLVHALVYKGMHVLVEGSGNLAVQFWLSARFLESATLLVAPLIGARNLNGYVLVGVFGAIACGLTGLIFAGVFPAGYVPGVGLTPFKIYSEYGIILILLGALFTLFRFPQYTTHTERVLITLSIILTIFAEIAFTSYVSVFGVSNLVGHILKLYSFWFIFRAIVMSNLEHPYNLLRQNEANLRQALATADNANKAKSEFLAKMSHELRTPLNAVIGFSQMLQTDTPGFSTPEKKREYVENILESGHHLHRLIGDILDLSKIEAGEVEVTEEDINLRKAVDECLIMMSDHVTRKQLAVSSRVAAGLPLLRADRLKVKQVLLNLLSNSIKFTPMGGRIEVAANLDDDGGIVLTVTDSGVGISRQNIKKVFEPFGQAAESYTRSEGGVGLGLALVRSLLTLHDATIDLRSEPGIGTVAIVHFPPERTIGYPVAHDQPARQAGE